MRVPSREKRFVWIVSIVPGILLWGTAIVSRIFFSTLLMFKSGDLIFAGLMISLFPPAIVNVLDSRWRAAVDKQIPEFMSNLSEASRTGITLTRAIELSSKRGGRGPLASELARVVTLMSWGRSLDDALTEFAERVDTRLARRTAILVSEINRSGGDIREVLETVSRHISELQTIQMERRSLIRPYVVIVYVAFVIFIFIDILLIRTFFTQLQSLQSSVAEAQGLFLGTPIDLEEIELVLSNLVLIEGLIGGLVAGKMGEGSMGAGLKHSVIMMIGGFVAFFVFVWNKII
jgi:flagellar protein FlaJ